MQHFEDIATFDRAQFQFLKQPRDIPSRYDIRMIGTPVSHDEWEANLSTKHIPWPYDSAECFQLGKGGTAVVYRFVDDESGSSVIYKVLRDDLYPILQQNEIKKLFEDYNLDLAVAAVGLTDPPYWDVLVVEDFRGISLEHIFGISPTFNTSDGTITMTHYQPLRGGFERYVATKFLAVLDHLVEETRWSDELRFCSPDGYDITYRTRSKDGDWWNNLLKTENVLYCPAEDQFVLIDSI